MDIAFTPAGRTVLGGYSTDNAEAYAHYLRGLGLKNEPRFTEESQALALEELASAVELDPRFAAAHAEAARIHLAVYLNFDRSESRLSQAYDRLVSAQQAQEELLELHLVDRPLPSVRLAEADYSYSLAGYEKAIEVLLEVARELPGSPEPVERVAYPLRRTGDLEKALEYLEKALDLDPFNPRVARELAETYRALRRYADAERVFRKAMDLAAVRPFDEDLDLSPDLHLIGERAINVMAFTGTVEAGRISLQESERFLEEYDPYERQQARSDRRRASAPEFGDCSDEELRDRNRLLVYWLLVELYDQESAQGAQAALQRLGAVRPKCQVPFDRLRRFWREALAYYEIGRGDEALSTIEEGLLYAESQVQKRPGFPFYHAYLGIAHALLGDDEQALRTAHRAVELGRRDKYTGPRNQELLAVTYTLLGRYPEAVAELEELLSKPYQHAITVTHLEYDPIWRALRDREDFRRLLER